MNRVRLSIATTDYDHFRDFRLGAVTAEGIDHIWLTLGHHEIFARFTFNREWDVSELSFAKFTAQVTRDDSDIIGLPVPCSRLFRFSSFYVNKNSGIKTAEDLRGKRVGSPEWAHSAAVYMRGWLHNDVGVKLPDIHWYQAGANEAGRIEKVELNLPAGVEITRVADKSLSEMLASGEIDCAIIARPPNCFLRGHPDVVRLFPDFVRMDEDYYARTKVWPIMHIIAIQRHILDANPWVARNLYNAFLEFETPQRRASARPRGITLPACVAAGLRAAHARNVRRRPISVRHRGKPADVGAASALCAPTGHRAPAGNPGRDLSRRRHDDGAGLDLTGEVKSFDRAGRPSAVPGRGATRPQRRPMLPDHRPARPGSCRSPRPSTRRGNRRVRSTR